MYPIWIHVPDYCKGHSHHLENFKSRGKNSYHFALTGTVDSYLMYPMKYKFTSRKQRVNLAEFVIVCSIRSTYQRIRNITFRSQTSICHSVWKNGPHVWIVAVPMLTCWVSESRFKLLSMLSTKYYISLSILGDVWLKSAFSHLL
jgi:hypothetical protein